jgi:hypothetical protein
MFIIEGVPAIIWAFIWWNIAEDEPAKAKWLTDAEKLSLTQQLQAEQQHIKPIWLSSNQER